MNQGHVARRESFAFGDLVSRFPAWTGAPDARLVRERTPITARSAALPSSEQDHEISVFSICRMNSGFTRHFHNFCLAKDCILTACLLYFRNLLHHFFSSSLWTSCRLLIFKPLILATISLT
jgi:hypothetical protein